jgi:hypothetical protein
MAFSTLSRPESSAARRSSASVVLSVGLMVLLFGLFALTLRWVGVSEESAWSKLASLNKDNVHVDVAIVGDSRAHVGLAPALLNESALGSTHPGLSIFNFAADGTDALHHASFVMHGLLKQDLPPALILWAPNPLGFNETRKTNRPEQLSVADIVFLARNGASFELLLDLFTPLLFPPYGFRADVKRKLDAVMESLAWIPVHAQTRMLQRSYVPYPKSREYDPTRDGYRPFRITQWLEAFERGEKDYAQKYRSARLGAVHLLAARDLLMAAKKAGSHVVIVEMPLSPWFVENLATSEFHQTWRIEMAHLASEYGATFLTDHGEGLRNEDFGDPAHLCRSAAERVSLGLGDRLDLIEGVSEALRSKVGE